MFDYNKYLRLEMFPHTWCPGCGCGIVMKSLIRAIDRLGLRKDDVCMVPGVGCPSRLTGYVDFNTLQATHGQPIALASGIKLAKPSLSVIVVTGGGDALAGGGDHFTHAARRNIDLTVLLFTNATAGILGGQTAPTASTGKPPGVARQRSVDPSVDVCQLAIGAGATYVARGTSYHTQQLDRLIEGSIKHPGFALVEILENCNTDNGRPNHLGLLELLRWEKRNTVNVKAAEQMTPEQLRGKILTGLLHHRSQRTRRAV